MYVQHVIIHNNGELIRCSHRDRCVSMQQFGTENGLWVGMHICNVRQHRMADHGAWRVLLITSKDITHRLYSHWAIKKDSCMVNSSRCVGPRIVICKKLCCKWIHCTNLQKRTLQTPFILEPQKSCLGEQPFDKEFRTLVTGSRPCRATSRVFGDLRLGSVEY